MADDYETHVDVPLEPAVSSIQFQDSFLFKTEMEANDRYI